MQTPLELKWDDFDRQVSEALTARDRDIRPPDWVWQRIVHEATTLDGMGDHIRYREDESLVSSELVGLVT